MHPMIRRFLENFITVRHRLGRLAGLAFLLLAAGCATVPPVAPTVPAAAPRARLAIINLTNYEWHIALARQTGGEHYDAAVPARGSVNVDVAGGDYVIEQAVTSGSAADAMVRRVPARLEAGQVYRWRLDTLLSDSSGEPAEDKPSAGP